MARSIKTILVIMCVLTTCMALIVPCFALYGDISTQQLSGEWRLAETGNLGDVRNMYGLGFAITEAQAQQADILQEPPSPNNLYDYDAVVGIELGSTAIAYYEPQIGTRAFTEIVIYYKWTNNNHTNLFPVIIMLKNNGQLVDYMLNTVDALNVIAPTNLQYLDFRGGIDYQITSNSGTVKSGVMSLFGANLFGSGYGTGYFLPIGEINPSNPSEAMKDFVDYVFNLLDGVLSTKMFGWFTIGTLIGVFVAISVVLIFLKYFAGG